MPQRPPFFKSSLAVKRMVMVLPFAVLLGCLLEPACLALAQTQEAPTGIPAGWESYEDRPDIFKISAQARDLGPLWEKLKKAHFRLPPS